jgi:hypothetical protein
METLCPLLTTSGDFLLHILFHGICYLVRLTGLTRLLPALQASKIIANLLVLGGGILVRAVSQAYRQAIVSECLAVILIYFFLNIVSFSHFLCFSLS